MKNDIVLAGVGGQGILTIAAIIGKAAMDQGLNVKQSEVHGMSQRGGAVLAHLRLSSEPILSDLIAACTADVIIAMEPMEALRQVQSLSPSGAIITASKPIVNIPDYPEVEAVVAELKKHPRAVVIDADEIAASAGNARGSNMVILGAVSRFLAMDAQTLRDAITGFFARKGDAVVAANLKAFEAGRKAAE
ncbi:MAG: indolepyruvate oxidoreductase subunit beta [Victivallales bacterium]|nr:indolepyruvate oxidoreductase subunit beta [Victivallales bacterium]